MTIFVTILVVIFAANLAAMGRMVYLWRCENREQAARQLGGWR